MARRRERGDGSGTLCMLCATVVTFFILPWCGQMSLGVSDAAARDGTPEPRNFVKPDAVKVGHHWNVPYSGRDDFHILTRSMEPFIVEIENFLSKKECEEIMRLASVNGFDKSTTEGGDVIPEELVDYSTDDVLAEIDVNQDGMMQLSEMENNIIQAVDAHLGLKKITEILLESGVKIHNESVVDTESLVAGQVEFLSKIVAYVKENPEVHSRYSRQTWLGQGDGGRRAEEIYTEIINRASAISGLGMDIMEESESLQVVRYGPKGHYHCHLDSGFEGKAWPPCCRPHQLRSSKNCQVCRVATLLFYLGDNSKLTGGATAFPAAHLSMKEAQEFYLNPKCVLTSTCSDGVVVQPRQGSAVLWYNYEINENGTIGAVDYRTYHGGCEVSSGGKWAANLWIEFRRHEYGYLDTGEDDDDFLGGLGGGERDNVEDFWSDMPQEESDDESVDSGDAADSTGDDVEDFWSDTPQEESDDESVDSSDAADSTEDDDELLFEESGNNVFDADDLVDNQRMQKQEL